MDKETNPFNLPDQEIKAGAFDSTHIRMETLIETLREVDPEKYKYFKNRADQLAGLARFINSQKATDNSHIMTGETFFPIKEYIEGANTLELELQAYFNEGGNREIRDYNLCSFISYIKEILKRMEQGEEEEDSLNFFLAQYNIFQQKNKITEIENREIMEILFEINFIKTKQNFDQNGRLNIDWFDYKNETLVLCFYKKVSQIIESNNISINLRKKLEIKLQSSKTSRLPIDNDFWKLLLIAEKEKKYLIAESSSMSDKLAKKLERAKTQKEQAAIAMALAEKMKTEKAERKREKEIKKEKQREEREKDRRYIREEREKRRANRESLWSTYGNDNK